MRVFGFYARGASSSGVTVQDILSEVCKLVCAVMSMYMRIWMNGDTKQQTCPDGRDVDEIP